MEHSACFIGHRVIKNTPELKERIKSVIIELINSDTVNFIFGSRSAYNDLCYETVNELKIRYPQIMCIKFRTDYENADGYTKQYLISGYDGTFCPKGLGKAGRAVYIKRNEEMIRQSDICIFYYDENYLPPKKRKNNFCGTVYQPKSGTAAAFCYAQKLNKKIINCFLPDFHIC